MKPKNAGEDVGKGNPYALIEGRKTSAGTRKISVGVPKNRAPSGPAAALGYLPGGIKANMVRDACTFIILITALFMTPKLWRQSACLSAAKWTQQMQYTRRSFIQPQRTKFLGSGCSRRSP